MKYQLLKNGIPVAIAHSAEEADRLYAEYECDECRGLNEERMIPNESGED